jgi:predicted DNA-binding protein (MmcQ/YjbR family)
MLYGGRTMKYGWIDEYCLSKRAVVKDFKHEWKATRYMIRDKMFALQGEDKDGKPIITVKLEPLHGDFLRQQYKDIVPGYYMNKEHWNSLYLQGEVPDKIVKDMLDRSYALIMASFSRIIRKEILDEM